MDVCEDLVVVCPCWVGEVDGLVLGAGVEFGEEEATEVDCAGAGDGLEADDAFVGDGGGGCPDNEALSGGCEVGETCYGEVFVVEIGVGAEDFVSLGVSKHQWGNIRGRYELGEVRSLFSEFN